VKHSRNLPREAVRLLETESKKLREENSELSKGMIFLSSKLLSLIVFLHFAVTRNRKKDHLQHPWTMHMLTRHVHLLVFMESIAHFVQLNI
jgi:hypothetical protein